MGQNTYIPDVSNAKSIIPFIKSAYSSLSPAEQKVASYVVDHLPEIIYQSITELADICEVGESTVIRFCRSIGFKGYHEFKLVASRDISSLGDAGPQGDITPEDSLLTMVQKTTRANMEVISQTAELLSIDELRKAVDAIVRARRVHFYGVGASGFTAEDAKYKFLRIGILCDAYNDSHLQAMAAATLEHGDVAVGFSQTGSTIDVIHSLEVAKKRGATIICITSAAKSPITRVSDIRLITATREAPLQSGNLKSKIAQLHVMDILFIGVMMANHERAVSTVKATAEAVSDKLY
ncbi:MAG TPA: MurR/RpiR family transcriptional regulator [Firmicutes bacterium]|nr:MurR/RpiR family transcriptional regulator [Bacillota bacterium]HHY99019.1 MurR/RpiR family transcriptional regulator [Bacillota bacterium]